MRLSGITSRSKWASFSKTTDLVITLVHATYCLDVLIVCYGTTVGSCEFLVLHR